eukprot:GHVU01140356.1.p2 GENE.GHVU01140356.1~~GHVU01140356.1.p2  ORF type:complete len:159 (+),score=1.44 GHVU01140356.1:649-1125(+)
MRPVEGVGDVAFEARDPSKHDVSEIMRSTYHARITHAVIDSAAASRARSRESEDTAIILPMSEALPPSLTLGRAARLGLPGAVRWAENSDTTYRICLFRICSVSHALVIDDTGSLTPQSHHDEDPRGRFDFCTDFLSSWRRHLLELILRVSKALEPCA